MGLTIAGGAAPSLGSYKSGDYFTSQFATTSATTLTLSTAIFVPLIVVKRVSVSQLALRITTVVANSTVRLGIYNDANGRPSTLIVDGGTLDSSSTPGAAPRTGSVTAVVTLAAGTYWVAAQAEVGTPAVTGITNHGSIVTSADPTTANNNQAWAYSHTGALAADVSGQAFTSTTVAPLVYALVA